MINLLDLRSSLTAALLLLSGTALAQQVVQRGAFGIPSAVLDSGGQWSAAVRIVQSHDVDLYIPDVSAPDWLRRHYQDFQERGQYEITMVTQYRTPRACRENQTGWGLADAAHLNACATDIAYRIRTAVVDPNLKTVTLITAGMVDPDGNLDPSSVQDQHLVRRWAELDATTQSALQTTTALVAKQMAIYDRKLQSVR